VLNSAICSRNVAHSLRAMARCSLCLNHFGNAEGCERDARDDIVRQL